MFGDDVTGFTASSAFTPEKGVVVQRDKQNRMSVSAYDTAVNTVTDTAAVDKFVVNIAQLNETIKQLKFTVERDGATTPGGASAANETHTDLDYNTSPTTESIFVPRARDGAKKDLIIGTYPPAKLTGSERIAKDNLTAGTNMDLVVNLTGYQTKTTTLSKGWYLVDMMGGNYGSAQYYIKKAFYIPYNGVWCKCMSGEYVNTYYNYNKKPSLANPFTSITVNKTVNKILILLTVNDRVVVWGLCM